MSALLINVTLVSFPLVCYPPFLPKGFYTSALTFCTSNPNINIWMTLLIIIFRVSKRLWWP